MKKIALMSFAALSLSAVAFAAEPKTYQATGTVTAVTDDTITVDKGKEGKWEIAKTADTKMEGGDAVKVGDKVTITYRMTAAKIELKPAKGLKPGQAPAGATH